MIDAVSEARINVDVHTALNATPPSARTAPAFAAWARPRSLSSISADPCHFACAFHRLWPWRTTSSDESGTVTSVRVPGYSQWSECPHRHRRRSPNIETCRYCDCLLLPVRLREPGVMRCLVAQSVRCSTRQQLVTARGSRRCLKVAGFGLTGNRPSATRSFPSQLRSLSCHRFREEHEQCRMT